MRRPDWLWTATEREMGIEAAISIARILSLIVILFALFVAVMAIVN